MWKCFEEENVYINKVLIISDNFFDFNFIDICDIYNLGANNRGNCFLVIWKLLFVWLNLRVCMYFEDNFFNVVGFRLGFLCIEDGKLALSLGGRKILGVEE